jgi:flavin reductase (DIM6/NTAB) family NADH-FMN oxidoreductase RutF
MTVDPETLRVVMRQWATGVTVLTARDGAQRHGMTVNAFTSVSLDPPLVLACIERGIRTHTLVQRSRAFAITILGEGQEAVSNRFAGRETEHGDRFEGLRTFSAVTGAPVLTPNLGYLDCMLVDGHEAGTHTIFVAQVVAAQAQTSRRPLVYFDRDYHKIV